MPPNLRQQLARLLHDRPDRPKGSRLVREWMEENGVTRDGEFHETSFVRLEVLLRAEGMLPYHAVADLDRSSSWHETGNDKTFGAAVSRNVVLVKSMPGSFLKIGSGMDLPAGSSLRMDAHDLRAKNNHKSIMLVENLEAFDKIDNLTFEPDCWNEDPLIVFRGSQSMGMAGTQIGAVINLPVHVFSDVDPAGVQIAATTPNSVSMVMPPEDVIRQYAQKSRNSEKYRQQISECADYTHDHRKWVRDAFAIVKSEGCMIPQEAFLRILS